MSVGEEALAMLAQRGPLLCIVCRRELEAPASAFYFALVGSIAITVVCCRDHPKIDALKQLNTALKRLEIVNDEC